MSIPFIIHRTLQEMTIPFTISLAVTDRAAGAPLLTQAAEQVSTALARINRLYSPFRETSLVRRFQAGDQGLLLTEPEFQEIYAATLAAAHYTQGDFDPFFNGAFDPTGYVKGWAVEQITTAFLTPLLANPRVIAVSLNGGGDLQAATRPDSAFTWHIGIEDPANPQRIIAAYELANGAVATSAENKRGHHIHHTGPGDLAQVTVLADHLADADVWATAGMAGGEARWQTHLAANQLTGLYITADRVLHPFTKGAIRDVQTA